MVIILPPLTCTCKRGKCKHCGLCNYCCCKCSERREKYKKTPSRTTKRGRPPKSSNSIVPPVATPSPQPTIEPPSFGPPTKKRRGRPKKNQNAPTEVIPFVQTTTPPRIIRRPNRYLDQESSTTRSPPMTSPSKIASHCVCHDARLKSPEQRTICNAYLNETVLGFVRASMSKKLRAAMKYKDKEKRIAALSSVVFRSIESMIDTCINEACAYDLDHDDNFESNVKAHIMQKIIKSKYGATTRTSSSMNREIGEKMRGLWEQANRGSIVRRAIVATTRHIGIANTSIGSTHTLYDWDTWQKGKSDLDLIQSEKGDIKVEMYHRAKKGDQAIEQAVRFILSVDHVQTLSWGHNKKQLGNDETVQLPKLIRRMPIYCIYDAYEKANKNTSKSDKLKRTSFHELTAAITDTDYKSICCVDYVFGNLVMDPIERLQMIIEMAFK